MHTRQLILLAVVALISSPIPPAQAQLASNNLGQAYDTRGVFSTENPHIELWVGPAIIRLGDVAVLKLSYHNIAQPYTDINFDPPGVVVLDPPLASPCKFEEHSNGCTEVTLRGLTTGTVDITAGASGQVLHDSCWCWAWAGGASESPVRLVVAETIWSIAIPEILREGQASR